MTRIKIAGIRVRDFKPKENLAVLEINFIKNGVKEQVIKEFILKHPLTLLNKIFLAVKSKDKMIFDATSSDPLEELEKYSPIIIEEEDKVEEKLSNFITDLCQRVRIMKSNTDASKHMRMIDEFKTARLDLILDDRKVERKRDPYYLRMLKRGF